jgi:small subunit ribosomal protein S11
MVKSAKLGVGEMGFCHITLSFNNILISFSDIKGNVISWSSSGKCGFRGSKKCTSYSAQLVARDATQKALVAGLKFVKVHVSGPGVGRDSAIKTIFSEGIGVLAIRDVTKVPFGGCRPKKQRRV